MQSKIQQLKEHMGAWLESYPTLPPAKTAADMLKRIDAIKTMTIAMEEENKRFQKEIGADGLARETEEWQQMIEELQAKLGAKINGA